MRNICWKLRQKREQTYLEEELLQGIFKTLCWFSASDAQEAVVWDSGVLRKISMELRRRFYMHVIQKGECFLLQSCKIQKGEYFLLQSCKIQKGECFYKHELQILKSLYTVHFFGNFQADFALKQQPQWSWQLKVLYCTILYRAACPSTTQRA